MDFEQSVARAIKNDGLTGDHIPSNAALLEWWTNLMGRKLTKAEAKSIRNSGSTIIEEYQVHVAGRTYGGKNTTSQIAQDALDLRRAAIRDTMQFRKNALAAGHSNDEIMTAIIALHIRNRAAGIY
jgi:filamentous hemagglutinin